MPIAFPSRFIFIFWGALQHSEIWIIRIKTGSFLVFLKVIIKDELHRMDRALLAVTKTSHNSGKFYVCKDSSEYRHSNIWEKYITDWNGSFKLERTEGIVIQSLWSSGGAGIWKHWFAIVHWNQPAYPEWNSKKMQGWQTHLQNLLDHLSIGKFIHASFKEKRRNTFYALELNGNPNYKPQSMAQAESSRNTCAYLWKW